MPRIGFPAGDPTPEESVGRVEARDVEPGKGVDVIGEVAGDVEAGPVEQHREIVRHGRRGIRLVSERRLQSFLDGEMRKGDGVRPELPLEKMLGRPQVAVGLSPPRVGRKIGVDHR